MDTVILAIVKLSLIAGFGFFLYRRKIANDAALNFLTSFVINFSVPFLIFSQITKDFTQQFKPEFWFFIVISFAIFALGFLVSFILSFFERVDFRREFIAMVSFQNCGYLPMNIALFLLPAALRFRFFLYIFFYMMGFNILMWSVGSYFIFRKSGAKFKVASLFTPPVISVAVSLIAVYSKVTNFIPNFILSPVKMIGDTSFVLSMVILGFWLAKGSFKNMRQKIVSLMSVSFLKLLIVPLFTLLLIIKFKIFSLLGLFLIIEASMPSAASLPIVVNWHNRKAEFVSQGVLLSHVFSIITVPMWIWLFFNFSSFQL